MGLGASMGLSPAESLYRIHVIQGRPTASAELIAANVRRAGHRLRVTGDDIKAIASVWRSDDPEFEFRVEWNLARAQKMGLGAKENWRNQPGTMLKWRAITEVARLACPKPCMALCTRRTSRRTTRSGGRLCRPLTSSVRSSRTRRS